MLRRLVLVTAAAAVSSVLAPAGWASAAAQTKSITGAFQEIGPDNFLRINPTPANVSVTVDEHPIVFTGGLIGVASSVEHTVGRGNLTFETHNREVFNSVTVTATDGTVVGTGSLVVNFNATGFFTVDAQGNLTGGQFTGAFEFVAAGGGLTGLHGSGKVTGVPGSTSGSGTYSGTIHF